MHRQRQTKTALVLSGGGARGAYQVGVLKGIVEILKNQNIPIPFQILSGTSAGAINTAFISSQNTSFESSLEKLIYLWSNIKTEQVFTLDLLSKNNFSFSQLLKISTTKSEQFFKFNSLLDTTPLKKLIQENCDFSNIQKNIDNHRYESVLITANNYISGAAVSFIQTPEIFDSQKLLWTDSKRKAEKTVLTADHVLASSAIPLLFPPIDIQGAFYGDGCVRNHTPCSPCIRLGATKLFVVGVRNQKAMNSVPDHQKEISNVSMIRILNTLLNAVLLDSVEDDVLRIQKINQLVDSSSAKPGLKKIPAICISPSANFGTLAREKSYKLPRLLRLTISALGHLDDASEILSYLLFDGDYCKKLIEIGYEDALNERKNVIDFFSENTTKDYTP